MTYSNTVTAKEAAIMLGVKYPTLIGYLRDGKLPAKKAYDNKSYVIKLYDLNLFERKRSGKIRPASRSLSFVPVTEVPEMPAPAVTAVEPKAAEPIKEAEPAATVPYVGKGIARKIEGMKVAKESLPEGMTARELQIWLDGYIAAQRDAFVIAKEAERR